MKKPEPMTLLQRAVIQRLRDVGQPAIADEAREHWQLGLRTPSHAASDIRDLALRADYARANAQAHPAP